MCFSVRYLGLLCGNHIVGTREDIVWVEDDGGLLRVTAATREEWSDFRDI